MKSQKYMIQNRAKLLISLQHINSGRLTAVQNQTIMMYTCIIIQWHTYIFWDFHKRDATVSHQRLKIRQISTGILLPTDDAWLKSSDGSVLKFTLLYIIVCVEIWWNYFHNLALGLFRVIGIFALYSDQTGLIRGLRVHTLSPIIMFKYCVNIQYMW